MSKNKESQLVVGINEDVAATSLLYLHSNNVEYYDKQDIVSNISFEVIITSITKYFFCQRMIYFVNKLYLSYQKYQTNVNVIYYFL